jgi:energy-coupling factor transport system permease protein
VAATVTALDATILGGVAGPVSLTILAVLLPGALAGVLPRLLRVGFLLALPLAISVLVVNLFFFPAGSTVLFRIGPITATAEGLAFAIETLVRLVAITGALALFYLTTPIGSLVVDLERRGVSPRLAFVISSSVRSVPAIVSRAGDIADAQRARGLDTQGSPWRRLRGLLPLVGPVLLGSIGDVEERAMALEARGFSRPGRRSLLWAPADRAAERVARWLMVLTVPALITARVAGWLP